MSQIRPALILLVLLTLITGVVYPIVTTELAELWQAPGVAAARHLPLEQVRALIERHTCDRSRRC